MINKKQSRREFLQTISTISTAPLLTPLVNFGHASEPSKLNREQMPVPTRPFGKTGVRVPILGFGGSLDINKLVLRQAAKFGVTYWDTAASYGGGRSEKRMGEYIAKYAGERKNIFLVTKSHAWMVKQMTRDLNRSLEKMNTDYVDLYFRHSVRNPNELDDDLRMWAENAKAEGKIRLFGFSTHSNMEECMLKASKLGWIDGIMMTYNYRLMHTDHMKRAVESCAEAGIGLTAMKTQGGGSIKADTERERRMAGRFLEKGFTDAQAKLIAVWENPHIASICSEMPNMKILMTNVAAAMNRTKLATQDLILLRQYARETFSDYCAGCQDTCEEAIKGHVPISDIMRYLMYSRSYGDLERGSFLFKQLPLEVRTRITRTDFKPAEQKCPQRMPIGRLMKEAVSEFS